MAEIKILNNEIVSVSTGKLGVGTTSPGNLLHIRSGASGFGGTYDVRNKSIVEANGEAYYATYVPDNSFSGIRFFNTSGLRGFIDYYHGTQGDALVYSATNHHRFLTNGVERVRLIQNGNVGIGTTSPSNLLHIHASGNNASALIIEDDDRRLQLGRDMIESRSADGSTVQNLYIQPNGNTAFATTSGNVGIGTTSPGAKLDVRADAPSTSGSIIYVRNTLADGANSTFGGISFFSSPGTDYSIGKLNTGIASALAFRNANNGTEYMRIDSSGNVGIGTTSPNEKLSVNGNIESLDTLMVLGVPQR